LADFSQGNKHFFKNLNQFLSLYSVIFFNIFKKKEIPFQIFTKIKIKSFYWLNLKHLMLDKPEGTTEIVDAICIYGGKGVGKTTFANTINHICSGEVEEENLRVRKIIQNKPMVITGYNELDEDSIKDEFEVIYEPIMNETRAFLLMFALDDPQSFEIAKQLYKDICQFKGNEVFPVVLIGNKCDLEHQIFLEEIKLFCGENDLTYFETSCVTEKNVDQSFTFLIENMIKYEKDEKISDYCNIQ
jgi:GTPase KRas